MPRTPRASLLLPVVTLLAACGQKGDLYFPSVEREPVLSVPADAAIPATPGPADEDDDATTANSPQAGNANPPAATGQ